MPIKPILFNTEMVRAILDGKKSCTRRLVRFLPGENPQWTGYIRDGLMLYNGRNEPCITKAPYEPGDILHVRETWYKDPSRYMYRGDYSNTERFYKGGKEVSIKWHPSIHMPKEAARIWLRVTDVRVERLQEITDKDAEREGAQPDYPFDYDVDKWPNLEHFKKIWNSTIKKSDLERYGWDASPWVWVIEFERCEKPEIN